MQRSEQLLLHAALTACSRLVWALRQIRWGLRTLALIQGCLTCVEHAAPVLGQLLLLLVH
jgi:hypothetical protein